MLLPFVFFVVDVKQLVLFYRQMLLSYAVCDRCYCHFWHCIVTDVIVTCCLWLMLLSHMLHFVDWHMLCYVVWHHFTIARGHWTSPWLMLLPFVVNWLMVLPVADVIATCAVGWCYCLGWLMLYPPMGEMADVVAMVAWWNGHWVNLILIQMLCVGPHSIYEADGIFLCFYLGMGHWPYK